ncbi:MAG: hypothetical protein H0U84_05725, partial [Thermoleophilaceae bacterium]|nr:hypothetical protein [Thermoleophilaceae bacterium]
MTERSPTSWAAWLVAGLLAVLAVSRLLDGSAGSVPVPVRVEGAETGSVTSAGRGGDRARRIGGVYVHVVGAVPRPGLYELGP